MTVRTDAAGEGLLEHAAGQRQVALAAPGVITTVQPGGPSVGNVYQIVCKLNGKWVGNPKESPGPGAGPPGHPELATLYNTPRKMDFRQLAVIISGFSL